MQSMNTDNHACSRDIPTHSVFHTKLPFPFKLHIMLDEVMHKGDGEEDKIVSWQHHGRAFRVHNPQKFQERIMSRYFNQTKYKSFQRQLHIYSFQRISSGVDKGAYYHIQFIRNQPDLSLGMTRDKIKGNKTVTPSPTEIDEKFYAYINITSKNTTESHTCTSTITGNIVPCAAEVVQSSTSQDVFSVHGKACYYSSQEVLPIDPVKFFLSTRTDNNGHVTSACGNQFNKFDSIYDHQIDFEKLDHGEKVSFEGKKFFFVDNCRVAAQSSPMRRIIN